jgi:hypothetical protein
MNGNTPIAKALTIVPSFPGFFPSPARRMINCPTFDVVKSRKERRRGRTVHGAYQHRLLIAAMRAAVIDISLLDP